MMKRIYIFILITIFYSVSYSQCWKTVAGGWTHSVAIKTDGTLWTWGKNINDELGYITNADVLSPNQVGKNNDWEKVSAGEWFTMAIKKDGTLWGWGINLNGQLGDGTLTARNIPVQIGTDNNWKSISTGSDHSVALKTDGTLWSWGYNYYGQLGYATATYYKNIPTQIGTDNNWKNIYASSALYHTLAIKNDGTLWAWGFNNEGQLGDGTLIDKAVPTKIGSDNNWESVTSGRFFTLALKNNGSLWAWGTNAYGQLGDGTNTRRLTPTQVGTLNNWKSVDAGGYQAIALKIDGTLWAWGDNEFGQLGNSTFTNSNLPAQIGTDKDWNIVNSSHYGHTLCIKTNGSLWTWGYNTNGVLGNGTEVNQSIPANLACPVSTLLVDGAADSENNISLYPNPAIDKVTFSKEIKQISVYSAEGRKLQVSFNGAQLDISSLPKGIYMLQGVDIKGIKFSKKLLKE